MIGPISLKIGNNMGYYTAYGINIVADKGYENEVEEFEKALLKYTDNDMEVKELLKTGGCYAKLYDIESWITEVATNYPHVLICLGGDGEDSDDLWETRWKGQEIETQKATIPPFTNPNLLTEYEKNNNN